MELSKANKNRQEISLWHNFVAVAVDITSTLDFCSFVSKQFLRRNVKGKSISLTFLGYFPRAKNQFSLLISSKESISPNLMNAPNDSTLQV